MTLPSEILSKLKEAREHYRKYEELMDDVIDYMIRNYGFKAMYREGEDFDDEYVEGVKAIYTVPVTLTNKEFGRVYVLEDGRVMFRAVPSLKREYVELRPKGGS